jgi:hypothetical protein
MRDFLENVPFLICVGLIGLVVGWLISSAYWLDGVSNDCEQLGTFRYNGTVYTCTPQGKLSDKGESQ